MSTTPAVPGPESLDRVEQLLDHFEKIEAEFERVREGLTHSHRLVTLGTIASTIAHEFNNILTPMMSYCQMALASPEDHELMLKAVEKSLAGAERAATISSSLLGFARSADEQLAASLPQTIDDTVACLARDPEKDGIHLVVDVPSVQVAISPVNLQQVLLNLILNAKQAMRRTGGQLAIHGRVEGDQVLIDVTDSGPGIPPQIIAHLFEPFVTHRSGETRDPAESKGTGLGLCICRDLIRAAGGSITVESKPTAEVGATFHIRLPLADQLFETT